MATAVVSSSQIMEDSKEASNVSVKLAQRDALLSLLQEQTKELLEQHNVALSEVRMGGYCVTILCLFTSLYSLQFTLYLSFYDVPALPLNPWLVTHVLALRLKPKGYKFTNTRATNHGIMHYCLHCYLSGCHGNVA